MSTPQTIDTAPKDGTDILLFFEHEGWIEGRWRENKWDVLIMPSHGCGCCGWDNDPPTHWLPLPEVSS